jgi:hypothetical protein
MGRFTIGPTRDEWSRTLKRSKIVLYGVLITAGVVLVLAVVLTALDQLPGTLRQLREDRAVHRACMDSQPPVDTISEWLGQWSACQQASRDWRSKRSR